MRSPLLFIALCGILAVGCSSKKQELITGEVDATEVDVSIKIPGRIARIVVREGDAVKKDQVVGYLQSREMEAKLKTVEAALGEAREQFSLADKTYARMKNLFDQNVIPRQQLDEATYKYQAAKQKVSATEGQMNEVRSYYDEMLIKAPIDGEVVQIVSHPGELVATGYPVLTILDLNDQWVTFNLREDLLTRIHKGTRLSVTFPALGKTCPFTVNYISALGSFAKWKATNEQGSFDLKTFETRARSGQPIAELRPGMTALIQIAN